MNEVRISVEKSKINTALIGLGKCGICGISFNSTKVEVDNQIKAVKQAEKVIQETPKTETKKPKKVSKVSTK